MADRIPCINPRCRRTADPAKMPDANVMICRRCFKALPESLRRRLKEWWRRKRKLVRLDRRKDMQEPARKRQLGRIEQMHRRAGQAIWQAIFDYFRSTEKPEGLDAFLEEMGL